MSSPTLSGGDGIKMHTTVTNGEGIPKIQLANRTSPGQCMLNWCACVCTSHATVLREWYHDFELHKILQRKRQFWGYSNVKSQNRAARPPSTVPAAGLRPSSVRACSLRPPLARGVRPRKPRLWPNRQTIQLIYIDSDNIREISKQYTMKYIRWLLHKA